MRTRLTLVLTLAVVSLSAQSPVDKQLAECRAEIDTLDRQIVTLLNQRAAVVHRVGVIKKQAELPIAVPAREAQVLDRVTAAGKDGPLPGDVLRRIYSTILLEMRTWEAAEAARR